MSSQSSSGGYTGALHRNPPFRAEHLGSLLRTDHLLSLRDKYETGQLAQEDLTPTEDTDIRDIIQIQLDLGFHAITDGEYRRHMFWGSFWPGLQGMEEIKVPSVDIFRKYVPDIAAFLEEDYVPGETVICTGKIKHAGSTYVEQLKFLRDLTPEKERKGIKLTVAAPNWYHLRYVEGKAYPREVYPTDDEYFADVAKAYQEELRILYAAGLRNVQFDDPNLAYFCSEAMLSAWGSDPSNTISTDDLLDKYITLYNDCISQCPADMHIGIHLCRGNFVNSRHFSEGGYDRIATKLFRDLNVHTYYLEYDTARAGGFEPLQYLPSNKNVVLGVVTSKFPEMERIDEMEKRVRKAVEWMCKGSGESEADALKRVGVSPQCGFASHSSGNSLKREDMVKKLRLVRELADKIWGGEL